MFNPWNLIVRGCAVMMRDFKSAEVRKGGIVKGIEKKICKRNAAMGSRVKWMGRMRKEAAILLIAALWGLNIGSLQAAAAVKKMPNMNKWIQTEKNGSTSGNENLILLADSDGATDPESTSDPESATDPESISDPESATDSESTSDPESRTDSESGSDPDSRTDPDSASDPYSISDAGSRSGVDTAARESHFDGWVQDDAGLLTMDEEKALESECRRLYKIYGTGVYIVTTPNFGRGDIKDWQRRIFSQYDLGADCGGSGVMLAISMAERDWGLVGFGSAQEAFSTYARERLGNLILDDLSDGEFYNAFSGYLSIADDYLSAAEEGKPYTEQHRYREGWRFPVIFGAAFLLSLGISAAVVLAWKKGMNTRVRQTGAMEYLKAGSFYLSKKSDLFLYHTVSRTKKPEQKSSGGSGGMRSDRSGTSGKF